MTKRRGSKPSRNHHKRMKTSMSHNAKAFNGSQTNLNERTATRSSSQANFGQRAQDVTKALANTDAFTNAMKSLTPAGIADKAGALTVKAVGVTIDKLDSQSAKSQKTAKSHGQQSAITELQTSCYVTSDSVSNTTSKKTQSVSNK